MRRVRPGSIFLLWALLGHICLAVLYAAAPQQLTVQSPAHTVALLEVYTSEG